MLRSHTSRLPADKSLRKEVQQSVDYGLAYLTANQNSNGWWRTSDHPDVSALALTAFNGDPADLYGGKETANLKRASSFARRQVKPDGSSWVTNLPTYNTSLCMMALLSWVRLAATRRSASARSWVLRLSRYLVVASWQ